MLPDPALLEDELEFQYSTSSGPGGQHVNKVETRVTARFDVTASSVLTDAQKARILERLATRITREGILRAICQRHRSRDANRRGAIERFHELIVEALKVQKPRKKRSGATAAQKRRRLEAKRRRAQLKRQRGNKGRGGWDD